MSHFNRSDFKHSRSFFPWGFEIQYTLNLAIDAERLKQFIAGLISHLMPELAKPSDTIEGVRGCALEEPAKEGVDTQESGQLFLVRAELTNNPQGDIMQESKKGKEATRPDLEVSTEQELEASPAPEVTVALNTNYQRSHKAQVFYTIEAQRSALLPKELFIRDLIELEALKITSFNLAAELFYPSLVSSVLGKVPLPKEKLFIMGKPNGLQVTISASGIKQLAELPLKKRDTFQNLSTLIWDTLQFDLKKDYRNYTPTP